MLEGVRSRAELMRQFARSDPASWQVGTPSGVSVLLSSPYRVGDYEGIPAKWDWSAAISKSALKTKLTKTDSRLILVHRPNGAADEPFAAVWIANKGADKTTWNWSPGTTGADLDALVKKAKGRLTHIDAFTVTGTGVRFAGIWVTNTGAFKRDWGWDAALTMRS